MTEESYTGQFNPTALPEGAPGLMRHQMGKHGLNRSDIGQMIEGKGILLAPLFQHRTGYGLMIGPQFNVFAAPADTRSLPGISVGGLLLYGDEIQRIADLKDVCGHDGILVKDDVELFRLAGNDPEKLSGWHLSTLSLLNGSYIPNYANNNHNSDNMYASRRVGEFEKTFSTKGYGANYRADWYWSLTHSPVNRRNVWRACFADGDESWGRADSKDMVMSSRAVRCEMVLE